MQYILDHIQQSGIDSEQLSQLVLDGQALGPQLEDLAEAFSFKERHQLRVTP